MRVWKLTIYLQLERGKYEASLPSGHSCSVSFSVPPTSYSLIHCQHLGQDLPLSLKSLLLECCISMTSECWECPGLRNKSLCLLLLPLFLSLARYLPRSSSGSPVSSFLPLNLACGHHAIFQVQLEAGHFCLAFPQPPAVL